MRKKRKDVISSTSEPRSLPWSSVQIYAALSKKFPAPAYALISEVRNQTGYQVKALRTADAICMSLYPSRGLEIYGFEFKSTRVDWLKEKDDPNKAEEIARFCDRWWIVAGSPSIVKSEEIPAGWGFMTADPTDNQPDRLRVIKEAPKLEPQPITRNFLAALMRKIADPPSGAEIEKIKAEVRQKAFEEGRQKGIREAKADSFDLEMMKRNNDALKQAIDDFERESGVKISPYSGANIGKAVKMVLEGHADGYRRELDNIEHRARVIVEALEALKS